MDGQSVILTVKVVTNLLTYVVLPISIAVLGVFVIEFGKLIKAKN